ncbi:cyclophilin-like fold protein [Cecembia calidifontis]|nr:cyclophilin-like fold protein [Cecembia calidifontis]
MDQLPQEWNDMENQGIKVIVKVGNKEFTASLLETETTAKLVSMLPLEMEMTELNSNEKYYRLPQNLPINTFSPGTIRNGDILLWGSNTLVIFYKTFNSSYSYTRIGKIDNPEGLENALGKGNVRVLMELEK